MLQIPHGNVHNFQGYPLGKNQEGMPASMTGKIARSPELSIRCRLSQAATKAGSCTICTKGLTQCGEARSRGTSVR